MKVVHFAVFAPSKSGMYESTKDQIKYERREGLDSYFIDALLPDRFGMKDGDLEAVEWQNALDADVWVVHSNLPPNLAELLVENRQRYVAVTIMHGPCENMLLKEWAFLIKNIDEPAFTVTHVNSIWDYDACVVINQHEYDISVLYDENDRLVYIPNSIDLERVPIDGYAWQYRHRPAIISCDAPRLEKLPVHILFASSEIKKRIPGARLNFFCIPFEHVEFFQRLVGRSKKQHIYIECCETFTMKMTTLEPFIRGADIGFNSNYSGIMSRVQMEMMALGVPVVSYNGDYTRFHAKPFDIKSIAEQVENCWSELTASKTLKNETVEYAYKHFDRGVHVKKYVELYQKLKGEKNG